MCGKVPWADYPCACGGRHHVCFDCLVYHDLTDLAKFPEDRRLHTCPDALKSAKAVMGEAGPLVPPAPEEPDCPECGSTEWVCAVVKRVCWECGADYPEEATT